MGFFHASNVKKSKKKETIPDDFYHQNGCKVCSFKGSKKKLEPSGSVKPIVYVLYDSPEASDVKSDNHLMGSSMKMVVKALEENFGNLDKAPIRFGTVLKCRAPKNKIASNVEIECCRNFLIEDIQNTKPLMILGIGASPLKWFFGTFGINDLWRGRIIPTRVGNHNTYFTPISNPDFVITKAKRFGDNEWETALTSDIRNMKKFIMEDKSIENPPIVSEGYFDNIELIEGKNYDVDIERVRFALDRLKDKKVVGLDIENYPLKPWGGEDKKLLSIAIGDEEYAVSYPIEREDAWDGRYDEIKALTKNFLLYSGTKVTHTLKHELTWLQEYFGEEIIWETNWEDIKVQAYITDCRTSKKKNQGMFSLGRLTVLNLGFDLKSLSDVDVKDLRKVKMKDLLKYNVGDVRYLPRMYAMYDKRLGNAQYNIYREQIETTKTLTISEYRGVGVNMDLIEEFHKEWSEKLAEAEKLIGERPEVIEYEEKYKKKLNPGSDPQLAIIFEKILGLTCRKRTGDDEFSGKYSVDKYVLAEFIDEGVELAPLILVYREFTDLISTYYTGVLKRVDSNGVLHTDYNSEYTDTGRLSSSDPNLQNWDSGKNKKVRGLVSCETE